MSMTRIMGLKVTFLQGPTVTESCITFGSMPTTDTLTGFARRMCEVCDILGIPDGHGRQSALGRRFGVTPKAARKWLAGLGYPDLALAVRIADAAKVNVNWLLQGVGPKHGEMIDSNTLGITEGIDELPADDRQQVLDFISYKFERADGWFAAEKLTRYMAMLDQLRKAPKPSGGRG